MNSWERFEENLKKMNISISNEQIKEFQLYYEILLEWNSFMNLTAITELDEVLTKHFLDSASLIHAIPDLPEKNWTVIDIGTGAGFPGIPLKILFPNLKITLLDSLNKRIKFLKEVIDTLQLKEIYAIHGRAEDFAQNMVHREQYDLCVSRAVANLTTLSEYCIPFLKRDGIFVSYKSEKITEEYEQSKKAIRLLGGDFIKQTDFYLPESDIYRNLTVIEKKASTPKKYPRKSGLPSKEPLF